MTGRAIIILAVLIVAASFALYVYNSGVIGKGFSYLSTFGGASGTRFVYSSPPSYALPASGVPAGNISGGTTSAIPPYEIPPGMTASQLSPYFHEVRFGSLSAGSAYSYGQITLYAYPSASSSFIDVTGWQIKSNRGGEYIPQAVNVYDPLGLTPASDILLKNGDVLYLYSTSAPVNLRLNECIGYLPNKTQFTPQLPQTCPNIDLSVLSSFSGACQNYIESLGSCQEPNLASPNVPQNDYACVTYLEDNFNYNSCFEAHESDKNFLSNEIWVWTGSSPLDPFHDNVELLDQNGLVVDAYSY